MIPEKLVRRRVDAINTGDYQALGDVVAPDVITTTAAESVHGLEALAGFEAFPDMCVLRRGTSGDGPRRRGIPAEHLPPRVAAGKRPR